MVRERFSIREGTYAQIMRRRLNAQRDARTYSRLAQNEAISQQQQALANPEQENAVEDLNYVDHDQTPEPQQETDEEEDDEADDEWVTLIEDPPNEIDLAIEAEKERHRQQAKEFNWKVLMKKLHSIYMSLKITTRNWSSSNCFQDFSSCTCIKHHRKVDLIDIHGQRRQSVGFCACTMDGVRLLQLGYLAGSPVRPQTAFSLPLLTFHNSLWNHCHVGAQPFTLALTQWLEPRSQRLFAQTGKHAREMRKPFSAAVDLYRQLEQKSNTVIHSALQLDKQQIIATTSCPACFGPQPPETSSYPEITQNRLVICLDGNFQHRHQTAASRNYEKLRTPQFFLPEATIDRISREIKAKDLEDLTPAQVCFIQTKHLTP
ncbi:hypothetical protein PGTUg99_031356 [Puccinia graminis f. sp. tritici]|uniref:CxC1-like cysteine cluster associated with KDZ transposases domain-containing protein n=1 Tax=Puccinia graminis f. sp. tritici TaxID=56615 RepID=A0A5B0Q8T3_PUCGR|nr:hypothetical protein PGTUg99_031356 [Puccinia graminis f. sp. tritici]